MIKGVRYLKSQKINHIYVALSATLNIFHFDRMNTRVKVSAFWLRCDLPLRYIVLSTKLAFHKEKLLKLT